MSKKYIQVGVLMGLALALCAGGYWLFAGRQDKPGYTGPIDKITIGTVGNETSTLVLIAASMGYFQENGLDVTIREYQSGNFSVDALLDNQIDLASCSEFALVERIFQRGRDLRYMGSYATVDNTEVIARKDKIANAADLRGKRIGVTFTSIASFYLGVFLTFNGLALDDVELVDVKPFNMQDALEEGKVDAVITWEPNAWGLKEKMGDRVISWPGQSQPYYWLLVSTSEVVRARASATERFMTALAKAEEFARQKGDEAKAIVGNRYNFDSAYLNHVWWSRTKYELSLDQALLLAMEDEARWMIKNGMSYGHKEIPDYLHHLYSTALLKASPKSVRLIAFEKSGSN
ncbi:MAG: ABC transporter substrate-binding protein [Syntrophobacteraceae bacterium]